MANRNGLTLIDSTNARYLFTVAKDPQKQGRDYSITPTPWEPGDPKVYWKEELHPWDGGLGADRFTDPSNYFGSTRTKAPRRYAKSNADLSNHGLLVPPPLVTSISGLAAVPSFISTVQFTGSGASTTGLFSGEAGLTDLRPGDVIVCAVSYNDADATTISITAGGVTAVDINKTNNATGMRIFTKVYTGPTVQYNFNFVNTCDIWCATVANFRGVSQTAVVNAFLASTDVSSPYDIQTVTTNVNSCMVLSFLAVPQTTGIVAAGHPVTPWTEANLQSHANLTMAWSYAPQATAGTTLTDFYNGTGGDSVLWTVALAPNTTTFVAGASKFVNFNSKSWTFSDTALISINSAYVQTTEAVMPATITDISTFNNELIIAMGYSTKIYKATAATPEVFSQASDNTYAGKLAVVGKNLWRSTGANAVSSCTTTPLTLASWGTSYTPGSTTYDINIIIDFGGVVWVGKPDGFYAPDVNTNFWNQTPQLLQWPDSANCTGAFIAKGFLWCPSTAGLLRIRQGEALIQGPELSERPDYQFWVRGGLQWGDNIYLICNDRSSISQSCIIKMNDDTVNINPTDNYLYHEWVRLGSTTIPYALGITINTTNPSLLIGQGTSIKYIKLGRGGGREINDPAYAFGTSWEIEVGGIKPNQDMTLVTGLLGVIVTCDQDVNETIDNIQYKVESESSWHNMLDTQEGGGSMAITNTNGYQAVTRYAPPDTIGQFFNFFISGSFTDTCLGTDRPEVREVWAFGFVRPKLTDLIKIPVLATGSAIAGNGIRQGRTAGQTRALLSRWLRDGNSMTFELPDYEETRTTRGRIVALEDTEIDVIEGTSGVEKREAIINVTIQRDDLAGSIYNA